MANTALFTFNDESTRSRFISLLRTHALSLKDGPSNGDLGNDGVFLLQMLDRIRLDPPVKADFERSVALFVAGKKLAEGMLADMRRKFDQETASHSASVELRELREGEWKTIQARKMQKV